MNQESNKKERGEALLTTLLLYSESLLLLYFPHHSISLGFFFTSLTSHRTEASCDLCCYSIALTTETDLSGIITFSCTHSLFISLPLPFLSLSHFLYLLSLKCYHAFLFSKLSLSQNPFFLFFLNLLNPTDLHVGTYFSS